MPTRLTGIFKMWLAVVFTAATTFAFAQGYNIAPNDTITAEVPYYKLSHFNILQNNNSNAPLIFSWRQLALSIPIGWTSNLCDNGHCYTDFPQSGTMDTVFKDAYGLMSVAIDPGMIKGSAFIQYVLWETNSPQKKDTLTWIISALGSTGVKENVNPPEAVVFTDRLSQTIQIKTHLHNGFNYTIYDLSGKQIYRGIAMNESTTVSTAGFTCGYYNLVIVDPKNKVSVIKILIIE